MTTTMDNLSEIHPTQSGWKASGSSKIRRLVFDFPIYVILFIWAILVIFPLVWLIYSSFKSNQELYASIWGLPGKLHWENFARAWSKGQLGWALFNSLYYSIISVFVADLLAAMAAYVLSRFQFRGRLFIFYFFMAGVFIPTSLTIIPTYFLLKDLSLINTRLGLTLVYLAWNVPFGVFVLYGFFKSIPTELMDAALIDGASEAGVFFRIVLPLGQSGIIAVSILNFLWVWNELLYALVIVQDSTFRPLPLALAALKSSTYLSGDWAVVMAGATFTAVPLIIIYILLQNQIIEGATMGALKG
jgi:N-acetylglucosamine transport system permease protein